jgi:regulator of replication initiation timing
MSILNLVNNFLKLAEEVDPFGKTQFNLSDDVISEVSRLRKRVHLLEMENAYLQSDNEYLRDQLKELQYTGSDYGAEEERALEGGEGIPSFNPEQSLENVGGFQGNEFDTAVKGK